MELLVNHAEPFTVLDYYSFSLTISMRIWHV